MIPWIRMHHRRRYEKRGYFVSYELTSILKATLYDLIYKYIPRCFHIQLCKLSVYTDYHHLVHC